jgi:hypothetical protein
MIIVTLAFWIYSSNAEPEMGMRQMDSIEACWTEAAKLQSYWAAHHDKQKHFQIDVSCISEWYEGEPA